MRRRDFGQYCGLARAMELVGERWALLIVRDLAVRPRRYTDLLEGLPGIPTNVLSARLRELERSGLIERRIAPAPARGVVYALTPDGADLEPAILTLGRWGTRRLERPRPGDVVTPESLTMSMRAAFDPDAARELTASWEIRAGDIVLHAVIVNGRLDAGIGPPTAEPDLVITHVLDDLPTFQAIRQAARCGAVDLIGARHLLATFVRVFAVPAGPR